MNLHNHTFGATPACIYLAFQLNEIDDPRLANRVGHALTRFRELVRSLERSNIAGEMTAMNVGTFSSLLRAVVLEQHEKFVGKNSLVADLVCNIMMGELKSLLRRAGDAKHGFKDLQRRTADMPGDSMSVVLQLMCPTVANYEDTITPQTLIDKSLKKLHRKRKLSTLY